MFDSSLRIVWHNPKTGNKHYDLGKLLDCDNSGCTDCINCINCINCSYCSYCSYCTGCSYCTDCTKCTGCTDCTNCSYCTDCSYCSYCTDCIKCTGCTDCTEQPLQLIGLTFIVTIRKTGKIKIGCQDHTLESWEALTTENISKIDKRAISFYLSYGEIIKSLAREYQKD